MITGAFCLVQSQGYVLAIYHPREQRFGLPGGAVEPGERPEVTVARELHEETGLVALNIEALCDLPLGMPGHVVRYYTCDFLRPARIRGSAEGEPVWTTESVLLGPSARFPSQYRVVLQTLLSRPRIR